MNYIAIHIQRVEADKGKTKASGIEVSAVRFSNSQSINSYEHVFEDNTLAQSQVVDLLEFLGDEILVTYGQYEDLSVLQELCERFGLTLLRPTALRIEEMVQLMRAIPVNHQLKDLMNVFEMDARITNSRSTADAIGVLFSKLTQEVRQMPLILIQQLAQLASFVSPVLAEYLSSQVEYVFTHHGDNMPDHCDVRDGLTFSVRSMEGADASQDSKPQVGSPMKVAARQMLAQDGPLASLLPGYEPRLGQLQMVDKVVEALQENKHAVIEAGTGTGKSLAYLIPAALYAKQTGSRVVVSTHTISLQDQIEDRDFPTLQMLFDQQLKLAVQKGRKNYVCLRKVKTEASLLNFTSHAEEVQAVMATLSWLVSTEEGVREEISSRVPSYMWSRIQSETDTCINKRCPFFRPCFYFRAKARAQGADIVVTNHSLLLSDLKADHRVLPKYESLVIDEAHHLEEQATKHLGADVHSAQLAGLSHRLSRDKGKNGILPELLTRFQSAQTMPYGMEERLNKAVEWVDDMSRDADRAFQLVGSLVPVSKSELRITESVVRQAAFVQFSDQMAQIQTPIKSMRDLIKSLQEWAKNTQTDEDAGRILDAAGFLDQWLKGIELLHDLTIPSPDMVTWVERRPGNRPRYSVHQAPIDVSQTLRHTLFEPLERVVLTSATLSVKGRFDYAVGQLGLKSFGEEGRLITANVPSPFNYAEQARLCVPSDVPELAKMNAEDAAAWMADSLYQLAVASNGRVLALFTSHQMLRETARLLRAPLEKQQLSVFAQDVDGPRSAMLEAFRKNPRSILLGAQSFWEGIDLPGNQLTTLVIVRLPFAPPSHPVTEARHERLSQRGQSPFWVSSLPEAVVRFRQGFGRLIRTRQDKGVVVIYDKRIITQRYGQTFIQSLSGVRPMVAPEQTILENVRTFLEESSQQVANVQ